MGQTSQSDEDRGHVSNDLQQLIQLARDKSKESREKLTKALAAIYDNERGHLTDADRHTMGSILHQLVREVELSVRKDLAEHFAGEPTAPRDLVVTLANDNIDVAYPILVKTELLYDSELIEIVQYRTIEHQLAITLRATISAPVSDALARTGEEPVISALLGNQGAEISTETFDFLIDHSSNTPVVQEQLAFRDDLPRELSIKLYWAVSAALRKHIVKHFELDPSAIDEAIEVITKRRLGEADNLQNATLGEWLGSDALERVETILLGTLRAGRVSAFVTGLARLAGLRQPLLRRFLFEEGGEGLATTCKGLGLSQHFFATTLILCREGRLGDKRVPDGEIKHATRFFNRLNADSAQRMVKHWRRDERYLNALRIVDET